MQRPGACRCLLVIGSDRLRSGPGPAELRGPRRGRVRHEVPSDYRHVHRPDGQVRSPGRHVVGPGRRGGGGRRGADGGAAGKRGVGERAGRRRPGGVQPDDRGAADRPAVHGGRRRHRGRPGHPDRDRHVSRGQRDPDRTQLAGGERHPVGRRRPAGAGHRGGDRRGAAVRQHRPGGRLRPGAVRARFLHHSAGAHPGRLGDLDVAGSGGALGRPAVRGRGEPEPGAGAGHRAGRPGQPADRLLQPRVRPHPGRGGRARGGGDPRHGPGRHRQHRQALPGPGPGQREHRHHRRGDRLRHHRDRSLPGAVRSRHRGRHPVRDDVQRVLPPDRPGASGGLLPHRDRLAAAQPAGFSRRGDQRLAERGAAGGLVARPAGGELPFRRRRHGADQRPEPDSGHGGRGVGAGGE